MKLKRVLMLFGMFVIAGVLTSTASTSGTGTNTPPVAHKSITEYNGSQTCSTCHPNAAHEVTVSAHYQQSQIAGDHVPGESGKPVGMLENY